MNNLNSGIILILVLILFSCNPNGGQNTENPTRGNIKIAVDENFFLLSDAELFTFQSIYVNAHITPIYKPEMDILTDFLNDSVRLMITSRKLTKEEDSYLKSKQIYARMDSIAYDGVAFIVSPNNNDTLFKYNTIKDIFLGKIKDWKEINKSNKSGKIKVVFDNMKSANVRFIKEKFKIDSFPNNCVAADKNEEVINYVQKDPNAIGVISVNWISDSQDSITRGFKNKIRVVAVTPSYDPDLDEYFKPYQAYIADRSYPFVRSIFVINRETFTGLGTGFIKFVTSDQGQRIVLKMGMVPATMPVRVVAIKNK
jgi:phosphate transport system substrate-binding protein